MTNKTNIHIPEMGDLAICCNCFEEKKIFDREPAVITWYCEDCWDGMKNSS